MTKQKIKRTQRAMLRTVLALPALLAGLACVSGILPTGAVEETLTFRIENATASTFDVTIEVRDAHGDLVTSSLAIPVEIPVVTVSTDSVSFSTLEPIGAAAAALAETPSAADDTGTVSTALDGQATVRVPGFAISEGYLLCGASVTISAVTTDASATVVTLTGAGTGTPGFDAGSIGESGERFLLNGDHFACGEAVVIRIDDDGASGGGGDATTSGVGEEATTGSGQLAVVEAGSFSPFDPIVDPGPDGGDAGDGPDDGDTNGTPPVAEDVALVVNNTTASFISVNLVDNALGAELATDVFLPAAGESVGTLACAEAYTITAKSLAPEALTGLLDEVLIVLQGDGTGTIDFDGGSIGNLGQRLLERDLHFACGDTIEITITDAGQPGFTEPDIANTNGEVTGFTDVNGNNLQDEIPVRLGSGTVQVE